MKVNAQETEFTLSSEIEIPEEYYNRMVTGVDEVDLMFGNDHLKGIVKGSVITIAGDGGLGKTTYLLQLLSMLRVNGYKVAYATCEEANYQVAYACKRIGSSVEIAHKRSLPSIMEAMVKYDILVVDSFQGLIGGGDPEGEMNSKQWGQHIQNTLLNAAKENKCALVFVLHNNTQGKSKGGTDITHAVDVNIMISKTKENPEIRLINFYKNRLGGTDVHETVMTSTGLDFNGVYDPEAAVDEDGIIEQKKPKNEKRKEDILNMDEPPILNVDRVMDKFGISKQIASNILRELVDEGKMKKYGRGANACWKLAQDVKKIYNEFQKV